MKVYIVMIDWDGTMRSSPEPEKVFFSKKNAETYLNKHNSQYEYVHAEIRTFGIQDFCCVLYKMFSKEEE